MNTEFFSGLNVKLHTKVYNSIMQTCHVTLHKYSCAVFVIFCRILNKTATVDELYLKS